MSEQAQAAVLALGCDHAGLPLLEELRTLLAGRGVEVEDLGVHDSTSVDYPDVAHALAEAVASGRCYRGVLVCGTGVGVSIAANRHPGVRAVVCSEPLSARMARAHNDANVLCFGARVIGGLTAVDLLDAFLDTEFEGGRHARRVGKIERP